MGSLCTSLTVDAISNIHQASPTASRSFLLLAYLHSFPASILLVARMSYRYFQNVNVVKRGTCRCAEALANASHLYQASQIPLTMSYATLMAGDGETILQQTPDGIHEVPGHTSRRCYLQVCGQYTPDRAQSDNVVTFRHSHAVITISTTGHNTSAPYRRAGVRNISPTHCHICLQAP